MQPAIRSHLPHHNRFGGLKMHGSALRYPTSTKTFKLPASPVLHRPRQTPARQVCRASKLPVSLPIAIKPIVSNKFLQGSVSLVLLAGVDAAWSGDWSRIGAISKDTELFLQSALTAAGVWHLLMGLCAYIIASQNGRPQLPVTAKALAVGTLPVLELMLEIQAED